jgi:hypothetical protein
MPKQFGPPQKLIEPYEVFPLKKSFRAKRITDFPTGKTTLSKEQEAWLTQSAVGVPLTDPVTIWIVGYASKLGFRAADNLQSANRNVILSWNRAKACRQLMTAVNPAIADMVDIFSGHGNEDPVYDARGPSATDDSWDWRAVEIHMFLGDPPPKPPHFDPNPLAPCDPNQHSKWSIAVPGGITLDGSQLETPIPAAIGVNVVVIRREEGSPRTHTYLALGFGAGATVPFGKLDFTVLPSLVKALRKTPDKAAKVIEAIVGGVNMSELEFTPFTADNPFSFPDLNGATFEIAGGGGGNGPGFQFAIANMRGQTHFRDNKDHCLFGQKDFITGINLNGADVQFGISASVIGGPMIQIH